MTTQALAASMQALADLAGMRGCALVDVHTGMTWQAAGLDANVQVLCEGATDYWRLFLRHEALYRPSLGDLGALVLVHGRGRLTLVSCGAAMLLVCVSREPDQVDWARWKPMVRELQGLVASF